MYNYFQNLYGSDPELGRNEGNTSEEENKSENALDCEISYSEINKFFFQNYNKSSEIDILIAEIFENSFQNISQFLSKLFNSFYSKGEYPKFWGEGIICPIFKGGKY